MTNQHFSTKARKPLTIAYENTKKQKKNKHWLPLNYEYDDKLKYFDFFFLKREKDERKQTNINQITAIFLYLSLVNLNNIQLNL